MDKRQQWKRIKEQAPDVEDWLIAINKSFGKPAAMRIALLPSGELLESGEFDGQHIEFDGKARVVYGKR
jgi:hypothetical protein